MFFVGMSTLQRCMATFLKTVLKWRVSWHFKHRECLKLYRNLHKNTFLKWRSLPLHRMTFSKYLDNTDQTYTDELRSLILERPVPSSFTWHLNEAAGGRVIFSSPDLRVCQLTSVVILSNTIHLHCPLMTAQHWRLLRTTGDASSLGNRLLSVMSIDILWLSCFVDWPDGFLNNSAHMICIVEL